MLLFDHVDEALVHVLKSLLLLLYLNHSLSISVKDDVFYHLKVRSKLRFKLCLFFIELCLKLHDK